MHEELDILRDVANRLEGAGIAYMVTGSIAGNFHGSPRMTRDIDVVVELEAGDADRVVRAFRDAYYVDREMVARELARRGMFNVISHTHVVKVDLIVRKDTEFQRIAFSRRHRVQLEGSDVWVTSPEDLILAKLQWARPTGSELQLRDVRSLLAANPGLDQEYLARWARDTGVGDLLEEARRG